jgi:hypothetical protein
LNRSAAVGLVVCGDGVRYDDGPPAAAGAEGGDFGGAGEVIREDGDGQGHRAGVLKAGEIRGEHVSDLAP